jgi:hypothetical protein
MTDISPDILHTAEEAYTASLHDSMAGKADYLKHVALAISEERDRHRDLIEMTKLLCNFAGDAATQDYGEDRVLSWIAYVTARAREAISKAELPFQPKPPATKEPAA